MQQELKARYAELRQAGVFSMKNFESLFLGLNNQIPYSWHDDDEALWGLIDTAKSAVDPVMAETAAGVF